MRSVLPGRHAAGTQSLVQPAHSGHPARNALCQQPAQPSARNVGAGHPVLFETTAARGHRALRIPPDLPERGGHRRAGHRHRRSGGRGDAPAGRIAGPCAENGPRPGAADLDGQRHLRRGGRAGRRTRREGRAAQDGGGGLDRSDLRYGLDVPLSGAVARRHSRPDARTDGPLHGCDAARGGPRRRGGQCHGRRNRRRRGHCWS